jgi:hypothetical protein
MPPGSDHCAGKFVKNYYECASGFALSANSVSEVLPTVQTLRACSRATT